MLNVIKNGISILTAIVAGTCLAYSQRTDSLPAAIRIDSITDTGFVIKVKQHAEKEADTNLVTFKEGRISIAQRRTIDAIKTTSEHVKFYLKEGLDTASLENYLGYAANALNIAKDGVFTNKGSTQTQRNLAVTATIIDELRDVITSRKIQLDKYTNNLINFKDKLDSLGSDSSLYYFPSDSVAVIKYANRLNVVNKEIGPVDSSLRIAVATAQDLQLKMDLMVFELNSASEDIAKFASGLAKEILNKDVPYFWDITGNNRPMSEVFKYSAAKEKMVLGFYIRGNTGLIFLILLLIVVSTILVRSVKKMAKQADLLEKNYEGQAVLKYPLISSAFIVLNIFQFMFFDPPFIFNFCLWSVSIICLTIIFRKTVSPYWMKFWWVVVIFFLLAGLDNHLLQASRPERWFMVALTISGSAIIIYAFTAGNWKELKERSLVYFAVFVLLVETASVLLNFSGRYNVSKSLMTTGFIGNAIAILFLWTARLINELLRTTYKVYKFPDRKLFYINFDRVGTKVHPFFYVLLVIGWFIIIGRNYYFFEQLSGPVENFLSRNRTVGEFNYSISGIFVFILILVISLLLSKIISFFATTAPSSQTAAKGNRIGLGSWLLLVRIVILTTGFFLAFAATGIPVDKLTIILGALGVGVGFGLQGMVTNLLSGLIIAFEKPVNVGDLLEVNGKLATMQSIGFRSSIVRLSDGSHVVIPNGDILSQHLVNWSMGRNLKRTIFIVGVDYSTNIEQAKKLFEDILEKNLRVLSNPAPAVNVKNFGPYAIDFEISFWAGNILDADDIKSELIIQIIAECAKAGIIIPVPQQEIHVRSMPEEKKYESPKQ
jgi:potassium-dependent mechanosensitive channel